MRRNLLGLMIVIAVGCASHCLLAEAIQLRADVPFAFAVGKRSLPAGVYIVEIDRVSPGSALGSTLVVRSQDGNIWHRVGAMPGAGYRVGPGARLIFNKYGKNYFLSSVESYGYECWLRKSAAEKEFARLHKGHMMASVAAR